MCFDEAQCRSESSRDAHIASDQSQQMLDHLSRQKARYQANHRGECFLVDEDVGQYLLFQGTTFYLWQGGV
jgi:hypothetical protein